MKQIIGVIQIKQKTQNIDKIGNATWISSVQSGVISDICFSTLVVVLGRPAFKSQFLIQTTSSKFE